uniref:NADH-ubiquinone oxidoreductase chain 5 n=1 Tax=Thaumastocoris safordi TaxID=1589682 RepID=A0A8T9ZY58_9HEMI|nr:NADH dehydrogenase subunit 5 [Thaumastocoris safordi]
MYMYIIYSSSLFMMSLFMFMSGFMMINSGYIIYIDYLMLSLNSCSFVYTILLDWMSMIFMGSVMLISSMVLLYSYSYMSDDCNSLRFLYLIYMFILSMLFMIMSPNLISILLGWDGLGLVSYALVIYFQNNNSYSAGMLTILMNRIGDVAILLCVGWCFNNGSWDLFGMFFNYDEYMRYIFVLLILCAFTKSAQIPFSSWLPAAMAAPTPVSALVHSSTLVTAGVYLMIRFSTLFNGLNMNIYLFLSMMTMFMAGLAALLEFDLKKIIALSTLSQLGLMMSILFVGLPFLSFLHLLTHAFFKALLFLCAGLMIHTLGGTQDIRYMGGLNKVLPFTIMSFMISNMALFGFPFLSGFFSKDLIMEYMYMYSFNWFVYIIFYFSIALTALYSFRLIYYVVYSQPCWESSINFEESFYMNLSMIMLLMMSLFSGKMFIYIFYMKLNMILMPVWQKLLPLVVVSISTWLIIELLFFKNNFMFMNNGSIFISFFLGSMWFMQKLSTLFIYSNSSFLYKNYSLILDNSWGEFFFSKSLFIYSLFFSKIIAFMQNNNMKLVLMTYIFIMIMLI